MNLKRLLCVLMAAAMTLSLAACSKDEPQEADDQNIVLLEKPVQLAVDDFSKGRCRLIESDDIGVIHERQVSSVDAADLLHSVAA